MAAPQRVSNAYKTVQGLLKTTNDDGQERVRAARDSAAGSRVPPSTGSAADGKAKAARLLTVLGREEAARVLRSLPESMAAEVAAAMADVGVISSREATRILAEFDARRAAVPHEIAGGPDTAKDILTRAFGVTEGEATFYRLFPTLKPQRFQFLEDRSDNELSVLLSDERAQTIAVLASRSTPELAARILQAARTPVRVAALRALASLDSVESSVLDAVEAGLRRRIESLSNAFEGVPSDQPTGQITDGAARLAEILKYVDAPTGESIIQELESASPDSAQDVVAHLRSAGDLLLLPERDLQVFLQHLDDTSLASFLKGVQPEVEAAIYRNVSDARGEMIRMERDHLGPMRRSDVDRVVRECVELAWRLHDEGSIRFMRGGEVWVQ